MLTLTIRCQVALELGLVHFETMEERRRAGDADVVLVIFGSAGRAVVSEAVAGGHLEPLTGRCAGAG